MTLQTPFPSRLPHVRRWQHALLQPVETRMIFIAGSDSTSAHETALPLFEAGHMPVVGEWFTEPLVALSGLDGAGDEAFDQILDPLAVRLLARCDAVLRVGGPSPGADAIVGLARTRGLRVFFNVKDALDG